jgi:hypothetical protein
MGFSKKLLLLKRKDKAYVDVTDNLTFEDNSLSGLVKRWV